MLVWWLDYIHCMTTVTIGNPSSSDDWISWILFWRSVLYNHVCKSRSNSGWNFLTKVDPQFPFSPSPNYSWTKEIENQPRLKKF